MEVSQILLMVFFGIACLFGMIAFAGVSAGMCEEDLEDESIIKWASGLSLALLCLFSIHSHKYTKGNGECSRCGEKNSRIWKLGAPS